MIELLILSTLFFGPCHGYEIKKMSPGMKINNNTLYPLLRKLVENGSVKMDIKVQEGKPAKKVYSLTSSGQDRLFELLKDFDKEKASSNDEFYIRVAFFQFLPKEAIKSILDSREEYLLDTVRQQKLMHILDLFPDKEQDILYMRKHSASLTQGEREFVRNLKDKYGIE